MAPCHAATRSAATLLIVVPLLASVGAAPDAEDALAGDAKNASQSASELGQHNGVITVPNVASITDETSLAGPCYMDGVAFKDPNVTEALPSLFLASPRDCQVTCETSPSCQGFTYRTAWFKASTKLPKVGPGACYLFGEGRAMEPQEHSISGPKYCKSKSEAEEPPAPFSLPLWNGTGVPPQPLETPTWVKKKMKELKAAGHHVKKAMTTLGKHLYNMDVCDGPRCCLGSRCHNSLPGFGCYKARGTTSCIGASVTPFKWGTCECDSGACSKEGTCPDSILMQQKYDQSAVEHTGALAAGDHNGTTRGLLLVAAAGVALLASLGVLLTVRLRNAPNQAFTGLMDDLES